MNLESNNTIDLNNNQEQEVNDSHISIDINDSAQLEAQGLKRVQIEGYSNGDENQDFLMDDQGNIYDLNGNLVATMGNEDEGGEQQNFTEGSE